MDERPQVICHIFAGLNGHIDGAYMFDPKASRARAAYGRMQAAFEADAIAYGAVTTRGFVGQDAPKFDAPTRAPEGDFVAPHAEKPFYVSIDPNGEIAWRDSTYRRGEREAAHVIEVISEQAPQAYRGYLRSKGVSYVVAGGRALDLPLALCKLRSLFAVERLLVCGGGKTDMAFLSAGVLDELSLVLSPTVSGEAGVASVFDGMGRAAGVSYAFALEHMEAIEGDGVHLVYRVERKGSGA